MITDPRVQRLRRQAMALPYEPGVYIMKDAGGKIIYIGKAKHLKDRVSQYFGSDTDHTEKVRQMVAHVDRFDYIVVGSEFEALVLECALIKQHMPKYNILLKDAKGYHYIRVSPPPYPRLTEAKQPAEDGARYIGPYMSGYTIRQALDEVNEIFGLAGCARALAPGKSSGGRPCLNAHIGRCCAPCTGRVDPAAYQERVEQALAFLHKGSAAVMAELQQRMTAAADRLDFEQAARLRDRIAAIRRLGDRQKVVTSHVTEQDVIALAQGSGAACFEVFRFTGGRLSDREHFLTERIGDGEQELAAARSEFLQRYYSLRSHIPPQVTVDGPIEDEDLIGRWLSEKAGHRVRTVCPQIGEQAHLVAMCRSNAAERIAQQQGMTGREGAALEDIRLLLGMEEIPRYIECYDISNTNGADNVAGMVVFEDGRPLRSAYRRFKICTVVGQDDYASMREVLQRRMDELIAHREEGAGFGRQPDLILLDGGEGHVSSVGPVVERYGLSIPVFGLVKDDRHRTRAIAAQGGTIEIRQKRAAYTLLSAIQEEVHRYAIGYHRRRRRASTVSTALTQIDGIGEKRARELLRHFGSVRAVGRATVDELLLVPGMTRPAAVAVQRALGAGQHDVREEKEEKE